MTSDRTNPDRTGSVSQQALLSVCDLKVRFGRVRAVSGVSFEVGRGEIYGIVGESGSGKSVVARSIISLLPDHAEITGAVRFQGENVLRAPERRLRRLRGSDVGFVFQDALAALDPVYTVGAQLIEVARTSPNWTGRAQATAQAHELLSLVGIADPARCLASYPHQLSGGMRQRVVIAAALTSDPKLIIADEPTTALDVTVQRQVLDILRKIAARGVAVILITHDLGVVAEVCDRVGVFYGGLLVEEAPVRELFTEPRHPYTAALLDSLPQIGSVRPFRAIPGMPPRIDAELAACPFAPRCAQAFSACNDGVPAEVAVGPRRFRCVRPLP